MMRVICASQKMGQHAVITGVTLRDLKPFSAGLTEMDMGHRTAIPELARGLGPHFTAHSVDRGGHSQENVIVTRSRPVWRHEGFRLVSLSPDMGELGIANDRWMLINERSRRAGLKRRRKFAHIQLHWNAAIQDRRTGKAILVPRMRAMNRAGALLEAVVAELLNDGFTVAVTGDFNWREDRRHADQWHYAPANIARRTGLICHSVGLDYIMYSKDLTLKRPIDVIPPGKRGNPSDHPWLVADLVWRRKGGRL